MRRSRSSSSVCRQNPARRRRPRALVGVAKNSKYRTFLEPPKPFFFVPLRQNFSGQVNLHIRPRQRPETIAAALVHEVHALDANLAPSEVITMREHVNRSTSTQRIAVTLLGVFGWLAVLLASIGLYGVMSYAVSQRTHELGLRLVMSQGVALTASGIVLGAGSALGVTRLLGDLLYKAGPRDPLAFGSAFAVMTIASLAACFVPAWRATRTDSVRALRDEFNRGRAAC
jgi:hypothetical protein